MSGPVWVGQGGCERRIEVFGKIKKNIFIFFLGGGSVWGGGRVGRGVMVDKNEELKFLGKFIKILYFFFGGGGVGSWGGGGGVRVDLNEELKFL